MAKGTWILERTQNDRFPYRLQIIRGDKPWLVLRTQDRWPAAGRHVFCLREEEPPEPDEVEAMDSGNLDHALQPDQRDPVCIYGGGQEGKGINRMYSNTLRTRDSR